MAFRLGIDSGGTFTDVVLFDEETGKLKITKTPSTPQNPSIGVFNGLQKIVDQENLDSHDISSLIHGTTVATNALLEYKGVKAALVLTRGFKDILSIVRQDRPKLYDYFVQRPDPLVPRHMRFEVEERTLYSGDIMVELNESEVLEIIRRLKAEEVKAIAVCLLHSYANPNHELRIKQLFNDNYPEATVSISSDILPEIREYERMSTTTINAYVMPIIERYLADLKSRIKDAGLSVDLNVMQSNGGIMTASSAGQKSVATILSGPAGGVIGSQWIAQLAGVEDLITLDMGGTSADICLINKGQFLTTKESEIGGHAIKIPMIDISAIGAGGGSIAWIDPGGLLRVGPQSAGAVPGPACYNKGGEEPTVTDANLVLGRLNPDFYVGGEMSLDIDLAKKAIRKIAEPLGYGIEEAAEGIIKVVNANMIRGIRRVSVECGHDPRMFSLFCFGGGGPAHGMELAEELNIPQVVIPISPGVNSAVGLLKADFRYDYSKTYLKVISETDLDEINDIYQVLEEQALGQMLNESVERDKIVFHRTADVRYYGQGYEVEVPVANGQLTDSQIDDVKNEFNSIHTQLYGYAQPEEELEIVYLRLAAIGQVPKPEFYKAAIEDKDSSPAFKENRKVYINGAFVETAIYDRSLLKPNNRVMGPAIIEQFDSTSLIKPGQAVKVDEYLNLIVKTNGSW
jgi:N-methylhydantoinase A